MKDLSARYSRQEIFGAVGKKGQEKIRNARVLVVGCGALGSNVANLLARSGVGFLRIVDRDFVELSNLQRQVMFTEDDVKRALPKAEAAKEHIGRINSEVVVDAVVADVNPRSLPALVDSIDLVIDGTDNFETRYLINDLCVKNGLPWIYGGVVAASGTSLTFLPGGPCLCCVWPEPPLPGDTPTCHTAGVLNVAPAVIGACQAGEALKWIVGAPSRKTLWQMDLWTGQSNMIQVRKNKACGCCVKGEYRYLDAKATAWVTSLCGRDAVQISPAKPYAVDLDALEKRMAKIGETTNNGYMVTVIIQAHKFTLFPDGRVLVHGISDETAARSLHAKYIGS